MELNEKQLRELKQCELNILRAFLQVCEKLELRYYLIGGTLLGAVRHGGFIPWDDDIDIGMPRVDYDKFVNEGQLLLPNYYFIQTYKTDPEWPDNFAKIRDCRTTFLESSLKNRKINHGVYIDIFPLDNYPEKIFSAKILEMKNKLFRAKINQVYTLPDANKESPVKKYAKKMLSYIVSVRYPNLNQALDARETMMKKVKSSSLLKNHCGAWGKREISNSAWFGKGDMLEFEGIPVSVPKNYHEYLKKVYGDYMQLPPESKRVSHHYIDMFNIEQCVWRDGTYI